MSQTSSLEYLDSNEDFAKSFETINQTLQNIDPLKVVGCMGVVVFKDDNEQKMNLQTFFLGSDDTVAKMLTLQVAHYQKSIEELKTYDNNEVKN